MTTMTEKKLSKLSVKQLESLKDKLKGLTNLRTVTPDYYGDGDSDWTYYCSVSGFVGFKTDSQVYVSFTIMKLRGEAPVIHLEHTNDNIEMLEAMCKYLTKGKAIKVMKV